MLCRETAGGENRLFEVKVFFAFFFFNRFQRINAVHGDVIKDCDLCCSVVLYINEYMNA